MMTSRPIRLLVMTIGLWTAGRAAMLWHEGAFGGEVAPVATTPQKMHINIGVIPQVVQQSAITTRIDSRSIRLIQFRHAREGRYPSTSTYFFGQTDSRLRGDDDLLQSFAHPEDVAPQSPISPLVLPSPAPRNKARSPFSLSAWALLRGAGTSPLSDAGELGGSQAGARLNYWLGNRQRIGLTARLSTPLADAQGKEAAVGIILKPLHTLPLNLIVERRIALDSGGRNDFELVAAAGVYDHPLGAHFSLSSTAEAGVVGLRQRDLFADGALEVEHPLWHDRASRLTFGAGLWGAVQPGVARLDTGPILALHTHIGIAQIKLEGSYRARMAGDARPGSGPVLSVGTGF